MSDQTRINKLVDTAYGRLDVLNNIKWTAYRDNCLDKAMAEERQHRNGTQRGRIYPKGASVNAAARLFVVSRIAQFMVGHSMPSIADVLSHQPSAIYAAALVANYGEQIKQAWAGLDIDALATLDYCELVGEPMERAS